MEFIDFLDRIELEIVRMVEQAGYSTEENTSLCLLSEKYAGFLRKREKKIVICTNNAKKKATTKTHPANTRNSALRNAIAPSAILFPICFILSDPSS